MMRDDQRQREDHARPSVILTVLGLIFVMPVYYTAFAFHMFWYGKSETSWGEWHDRLDYRRFVWGLPALLAAGSTIFTLAYTQWHGDGWISEALTTRAEKDLLERNHAAAEVSLTRLLELNPRATSHQFDLARTVDAQGQSERAAALIGDLAPDDRIEYPPAHLWLARRLLMEGTPASRARAEAHLIRLRGDANVGAAASSMLAELYLMSGRDERVLLDDDLLKMAEGAPELRLMVFEARVRRGNFTVPTHDAESLVRYFRNQLKDSPDDAEIRFRLGRAHALAGELAAAVMVLKEGVALSGGDRFAAPLAELAAGLAAQAQRDTKMSPDGRTAAYREALELLRQHGSNLPKTRLLVARLHHLLGEQELAEDNYLQAVNEFPAARLELADLYDAQARVSDADAQCKLLLKQLGDGTTRSSTDRRCGVLAALRMKNFEQAEAWLRAEPPSKSRDILLVEIYTRWWDSLDIIATKDLATSSPRLDLLQQALLIDPWNSAILHRLLRLGQRSDRVATEAMDMLKAMLAEGKASATAYLMLGSDAFERGDTTSAVKYLERAQELDPQAALALNNLAWVVAEANPPDLQRAFRLANAAVQQAPRDARIRDTRFRILVRQQRWKEALTDLEACASAMAGNADFHLAAAEVYEQVGIPDLAKEHRNRAAKALEKPPQASSRQREAKPNPKARRQPVAE